MKLDSRQIQNALRRCESEAIQHIGKIQPHGCLIVLDTDAQHTILQVSTNISSFFDVTPEEALGQSFSYLVEEDQERAIRQMLFCEEEGPRASLLIYSIFSDDVLQLQSTAHRSGDVWLVECELIESPFEMQEVLDLFNPVRAALWKFEAVQDDVSYFAEVADLVQQVTGFDRVMIYRFDAQWEGEVIAESRTAVMESYLGNRFPAGDIPAQARALYTRNLLRLVADVNARPVATFPLLNPKTEAPLDLSFSVLRAFAPVHVDYLRNMKVGASLSISLLRQGHLWGLIACHHAKPRCVSHPVREISEFIGKLVSMKLAALEMQTRADYGSRLGKTMVGLSRAMVAGESTEHLLKAQAASLLEQVGANGALVVINGRHYRLGELPPATFLNALIDWLPRRGEEGYFAAEQLASNFPAAIDYAEMASGLLATPLVSLPTNGVLWFRPEKLRQVNWAGKPEKTVSSDEQGVLRISPRTSFAVWTETWRQRAEAWDEHSIEVGCALSDTLLQLLVSSPAGKRLAVNNLSLAT